MHLYTRIKRKRDGIYTCIQALVYHSSSSLSSLSTLQTSAKQNNNKKREFKEVEKTNSEPNVAFLFYFVLARKSLSSISMGCVSNQILIRTKKISRWVVEIGHFQYLHASSRAFLRLAFFDGKWCNDKFDWSKSDCNIDAISIFYFRLLHSSRSFCAWFRFLHTRCTPQIAILSLRFGRLYWMRWDEIQRRRDRKANPIKTMTNQVPFPI